MILEKSHIAQQLIEQISVKAPKVSYINTEILSKALLFVEKMGIPNHKHEDYKYCNIEAILKKEFKNCTQEFEQIEPVAQTYKLKDTHTVVIINGNYSQSLSDKINEEGVSIISLSLTDKSTSQLANLADVEQDVFVSLNTAFSANGFYLRVAKGVSVAKPIHVIYFNSSHEDSFLNSRNFIHLEENSRATVIEETVLLGSGKVFTNYLSEKLIEANANLISVQVQQEGEKGYSVNTSQVELNKGGNYENITITLSGQLVRNNHNVVLKGENASAHLFGLFSSQNTQLVDNHTLMDHQVPNCESNELYKGIVNDKSTGVFNGKIFVRKDAQKTNAYQSSKNILLSDNATINTKPQLEIYANDVKCSHGTSTGKIDESALFYLKARGIGEQSARKILLNSFAQEVIHKIDHEELRARVTAQFENVI